MQPLKESIKSLFHPFKTMDDVIVAFHIMNICKIYGNTYSFTIIKKYFEQDIQENDLKFLFSRIQCLKELFPLNYVIKKAEIEEKIEKILQNCEDQILKTERDNCYECSALLKKDEENSNQHKGRIYYYNKKSADCLLISFKCKNVKQLIFQAIWLGKIPQKYFMMIYLTTNIFHLLLIQHMKFF